MGEARRAVRLDPRRNLAATAAGVWGAVLFALPSLLDVNTPLDVSGAHAVPRPGITTLKGHAPPVQHQVPRAIVESGEFGPTDLNVPGVVESVGTLRGAALAMVVGAILILASAWIASSAAQPTPPAVVTNPAPTP